MYNFVYTHILYSQPHYISLSHYIYNICISQYVCECMCAYVESGALGVCAVCVRVISLSPLSLTRLSKRTPRHTIS